MAAPTSGGPVDTLLLAHDRENEKEYRMQSDLPAEGTR